MEINVVTAEEYDKCCGGRYLYFYNSKDFHELNKDKVNEVEFLVFQENKKKLALAIGIDHEKLMVPYSAPFGVFEQLHDHIQLEDIENSLELLEEYAKKKNVKEVIFRLPPVFYDSLFLSKLQNCLWRKGYQMDFCDLNYQFELGSTDNYIDTMRRNAKKNLKKSMKQNWCFKHCDSETEKKAAYDVIANNRSRKGYALRMTYKQVFDTIQLTEHDFFLLKLDDVGVAAAIIFRVNEDCYQVIYWGDVAGYEEMRPMNYLAFKVYEYYSERSIKILDIGPSTENGIPNYGLCDFKESIGCTSSAKYMYRKLV